MGADGRYVSVDELVYFFIWYGDHRYLHVLTHSSPTRRSSDLAPTTGRARGASTRLSWCRAATEAGHPGAARGDVGRLDEPRDAAAMVGDRKSTRLNSSH